MFSLCPSTRGGGTLVPGYFPGLWSQVLSGGTPVPGSFPGLWSQVLSGGGVPHSQLGGGGRGGSGTPERIGPPQLGLGYAPGR